MVAGSPAGGEEQGARGEFRVVTLLRLILSRRGAPVAGRTLVNSTPTLRAMPRVATTQRIRTRGPCPCGAPMRGVNKRGA